MRAANRLEECDTEYRVTADIMKAVLENANWSKEVTLLLFNKYETKAREALMLLGEEGEVLLERKGQLFRVMSSAGWIFFPLKRAAPYQLVRAQLPRMVDEVDTHSETEAVYVAHEANMRDDDKVILPASQLPQTLKDRARPRKRSVSVAPQSTSEAYEALTYRDLRRRKNFFLDSHLRYPCRR